MKACIGASQLLPGRLVRRTTRGKGRRAPRKVGGPTPARACKLKNHAGKKWHAGHSPGGLMMSAFPAPRNARLESFISFGRSTKSAKRRGWLGLWRLLRRGHLLMEQDAQKRGQLGVTRFAVVGIAQRQMKRALALAKVQLRRLVGSDQQGDGANVRVGLGL